jgi:hypothetical protein
VQVIIPRKDPRTVYTSKYTGVMFHSTKKQWRAAISVLGNKKILGYYETEHAAALAVNEAQLKYNGQFARLNIIEEENRKYEERAIRKLGIGTLPAETSG